MNKNQKVEVGEEEKMNSVGGDYDEDVIYLINS